MVRKKTHEQFIAEVFDLVEDEYTVLGKYKNTHTKIQVRHEKCGDTYEVMPSKFLIGRRCPKCAGNKKKNHEQFVNKVLELVGNEYTFLGKYINALTTIPIKHNVCGHEYKVNPSNFINNGKRCPKCANRPEKNTDIFKKEVFELMGDEYEVIGEYTNCRTNIEIRHTKCNYQWLIRPDIFLQGNRCPKCAGNVKKTHKEFIKEVFDLVGEEYTILGKYINFVTKVAIRHNECGYEYLVAPDKILYGRRCPKCRESRGEKEISKWLDERKIQYQRQHRFDDCRYIQPLPFDFAIFYNDKLLALIEYDGIQHFEPVEVYDGEVGLELTKKRDEVKNDYCKKNNIPLLRIPYWDFDKIDYLLEKELSKCFANK